MRIDKRNMEQLKKITNRNGSSASSAQLSDDNGAEVLYFGSEEQGDEEVDKLLFGKCNKKIYLHVDIIMISVLIDANWKAINEIE